MVDSSMRSDIMIRLKSRAEIRVDEEAAKKWLANGAQPTQTVEKTFKDSWYREIID